MNWIKTLVGLLAVAAGCSAVAAPLLSEGFDDVAALPGKGWVLLNQSTPPGSTGWFQGEPSFFPAAAGPADSYIAANFNNAAFGGSVSNWLLTPQVLLANGESIRFSLRLPGEGLLDRVEVYLGGNGASTDVGRDFTLLAAYESDSDTGWQQQSLLVDGLVAPASGRLAFRYVVDDTSLNGDYIGIDSVSLSAIPEPATVALVCLGMIALHAARRPRRHWLAAAGLYAGALAAQAGQNGVMHFPNVQVVQQQAAPLTAEHGGFMAYKDPVTGQLTGPDPERAALLTAAARAPAPLMRLVRPVPKLAQRGGVSLMLDERQTRYAIARKAGDGSITHSCEPAAGEHK
ncbi:PEP-CTERM protein-sorting domain-containing protein [Duganella sp. CF402]|uniref:choice-of-anchor J domain-containing protein n=1 Tax=unclassified Duganella TaxID=2636909 RepID=UPI0008D78BCF|nr:MULTISPECIES: choice-of-anchor J domain-containing protein [unclassified Duganella]RZT10632.1 putative secreted protein with PEP-CTERM sorting signal [Duganella sp. BK701]SEL05080.1 PEP-CTERM protein-sorting domain-containing protein [Duganella sp. CF402]